MKFVTINSPFTHFCLLHDACMYCKPYIMLNSQEFFLVVIRFYGTVFNKCTILWAQSQSTQPSKGSSPFPFKICHIFFSFSLSRVNCFQLLLFSEFMRRSVFVLTLSYMFSFIKPGLPLVFSWTVTISELLLANFVLANAAHVYITVSVWIISL